MLEEDAFYFTTAQDIADILNNEVRGQKHNQMINNNAEKIHDLYSWDHIVDSLEKFLVHAAASGRKR